MATLLVVMAVLLVIGGGGLFWVAWRGIQVLRQREAADAAPNVVPTALASDAGASLTLHSEDEEDEAPSADAGPTCPLPIHPMYCRRNCRDYNSRQRSMHARRISDPLRAGLGVCGEYKVFAEDQRAADGGAGGGLVEYFDKSTSSLVGAEDTRAHGCGSYGTIPKCKLEIKWQPPSLGLRL